MSRRVSFPPALLANVVAKAYDLSVPQGMGYLHFVPGPIDPKTLERIVAAPLERVGIETHGICMDYVQGRAIKLTVIHDPSDDSFYLLDDGRWYDHSAEQWSELIRYVTALVDLQQVAA